MKIKLKLILVSFCFLVAQQSSTAQNNFGIRLGGHWGSFQSNNQAGAKFGLDLAILKEFKISDHFSIQPELHLMQKGNKFRSFLDNSLNKISIYYVHLPILAKYTFDLNEKFQLYGLAGPSFATPLLIRQQSDTSFNDWNSIKGSNLRRFQIGFDAGLGISKKLKSGRIFLDVRYLMSINPLVTDSDASSRNKGINIGTGYIKNF